MDNNYNGWNKPQEENLNKAYSAEKTNPIKNGFDITNSLSTKPAQPKQSSLGLSQNMTPKPPQPNYYGYYSSQSSYSSPREPSQSYSGTYKAKSHGGKSKILALVVTVALIFGIIGSGVTYYLISNSSHSGNSGNNLLTPSPLKNNGTSDSSKNSSGESALGVKNTDFAVGDITAIAAKAAPSVVEITTEVVQYNRFVGKVISQGAGSGVIISEDGYIISNYHVIEGANNILVRTNDGKEYKAALVGMDSKNDIAVLKIEATGLTKADFANSDEVVVGELAVAIGNPLGTLGGTVTEGIISAKDREIEVDGAKLTLLQTSAAVNPGNSGGGLFNKNGALVGIVTAKSSGTGVEGLGFAIPANLAKEISDTIISSGSIDKSTGESNGQNNSNGLNDLNDLYDSFFDRGA